MDVISPDIEGSAAFYGGLFGWNAEEAGDPEATGGYRMLAKDGRYVAALAPPPAEGIPPVWGTYVAVDSADDVGARVLDAGGQVMVAPFDVLDAGRMAVFTDSEGAVFNVWQAKDYPGAQLVNEPGSFCWSELHSRDIEGAKTFYEPVLGWRGETADQGPMAYTEWKLGDDGVAGMVEMGDQIPAEVAPHWLVYFAAEDCDATVERCKELGGRALVEPMDIPAGRFASVADPNGAAFGVIRLSA